MRSIRRFVYSVVLALNALTFTPSPASAQEMHGSFTLKNEVRWQNYVVPAGDYRFEVQPKGPSAILLLRKVSGSGAGFLILANNADSSKASDLDRLVVVAQAERQRCQQFGASRVRGDLALRRPHRIAGTSAGDRHLI